MSDNRRIALAVYSDAYAMRVAPASGCAQACYARRRHRYCPRVRSWNCPHRTFTLQDGGQELL